MIQLATEGLARFKSLPPKFQYAAYCVAGCAVLILLMSVFQGPDQTVEQTTSESEQEAIAILEAFGGNLFQEDSGRVHVKMPAKTADDDLHLLNRIRYLRSLELSGTKVTNNGLDALVPHETLETLALANTAVTDVGMQSIGKLKNLKVLDLSGCKISDNAIPALLELQSLDHLVLNETDITDTGCNEIAKIASLTKIFLNTTSITDAGVAELAKLTKLQRLGVGDTQVSNAGLQYLTQLQSLEVLGVGDTKVSNSGLKHLEQLPQLKTLELTNSSVSSKFGRLWTSRSKIEEMLKEARNPPKTSVATSKPSRSTDRSAATTRSTSSNAGMSDSDKFALQLLMGAAMAEQQQNQMRQQQQSGQRLYVDPGRVCDYCGGTGVSGRREGSFSSNYNQCFKCGGRGRIYQ